MIGYSTFLSLSVLCACVCVLRYFSHVWLCNPTSSPTIMDCDRQAPVSMGFARWEYWSRLPYPSPGDPPDPGIKPKSPASPVLQADSLPLSHWGSLKELLSVVYWEKDGQASPDVFLRGFQDGYFYYVCYFFNCLLWKILNIWDVESKYNEHPPSRINSC